MIAALLLSLALTQVPQVPLITAEEQARILHPSWVQLLTQSCTPLRRASVAHRDVAEYRCPEGLERLDIATGQLAHVVREPVKAKLKRWGTATIAGVVMVIYLWGQAQ